MPLASPRYAFTLTAVAGAPDDPGVYALYAGEKILGIGAAIGRDGTDTIRGRLLAHLRAGGIDEATHYKWELCSDPEARRTEYLRRMGGRIVLL